jgi:hypothetical protein
MSGFVIPAKAGTQTLMLALASMCVAALTGCGTTVTPVRYQPVPVLLTKPCLAGKALPERATVRTLPVCDKGRVECLVDAKTDIEDLKREADALHKLAKECQR